VTRYRCIARLDQRDRRFSWDGDDGDDDRVVVDDDGYVIEADDGEGEATIYDLDAIEAWCRSSESVRDSSPLLNAWNLFIDIPDANALFKVVDAGSLGIYDKLFRETPTASLVGGSPDARWSDTELATLRRVLLLGLAELRARLR
jgi:hypothetical protein